MIRERLEWDVLGATLTRHENSPSITASIGPVADPDIVAVYNPLPSSMRLGWAIKSANMVKDILCEKPLGATDHV